ncbi:MAG TPA: hypothetical protein VN258_19510 [Mobilitalea sp.]|nr:hypothetical protein [Mobilitalea sp.]
MYQSWIYEPEITYYEALLFYNAMQRHLDPYYYKPIAVAKREQSGMKYRFLCIAMPKYAPGPPSHFADIEIYKPIAGMPYASGLYRIDFDKMFPHRMPFL